jgi:hypothetical protein
MLVRGSPIHNEVLDVISALLRVLRVPKTFAAISKRSVQQQSQEFGGKDPMTSDAHQQAPAGGWLAWWIGPSPTSTTQPIASDASSVQSNVSTQQQDIKIVSEQQQSEISPVTVSIGEEEDAELLAISWRTICSVYSSFPAHLRIKYPTLVLEIAQFVEWRDRIAGPSTKPLLSSSSVVSTGTDTAVTSGSELRIDRLAIRSVSKDNIGDPSSPTLATPTSGSSRIQVV